MTTDPTTPEAAHESLPGAPACMPETDPEAPACAEVPPATEEVPDGSAAA